jgi:excisionase family DNA binding protein
MESFTNSHSGSRDLVNSDLPELLTIAEASAALRVHRNTVDKLVASGELPAAKVGGQWRIRREALHDYLRRAEKRPSRAA